MKTTIIIATIIVLFLNLALVTNAQSDSTAEAPTRQDGRLIQTLEWYAPPGEFPGRYEEYLSRHPLVAADFSEGEAWRFPSETDVSILVDADLYAGIASSLDQYISDLQAEGYSVMMQTVSGGTPQEIKTWVTERYQLGSYCFVFVGDITAAWAEVSESQFPCDLFYMDLDGSWSDDNSDGVYETHVAGSGDMAPEVYIGRIYATTLSYASEVNMINDYFTKCHAYRRNELVQPWRGLEYIDEDWFSMEVELNLVYDDSLTHHDYGYYTTGADYLDQMDVGHQFVQVCAHSYSSGHHFSTRPTESAAYAHVYVHSPSARATKLLLGSDDGIKVWLNGQNIYTDDSYKPWLEDAVEVETVLNEGWNRLLCKVSQGGGKFGFSARFTDLAYVTHPDLEYQFNDPSTHSSEPLYIRGWLVNGFHQDISDNFWNYLTTNYLGVNESSISPIEGETTGGNIWTKHSSSGRYVDLSETSEQNFGACYVYARVYSDYAQSCQLWMGYDDGVRIWLNGTEVLYDNRYGEFEEDMTKTDVSLLSGENRLLIKVSQWMGGHGFSAKFCYSNGEATTGLTYDPEPSPVSHISEWLVNGPYLNPDQATRLTSDYLGDEISITPSEDDAAPLGTWESYLRGGVPVELDTHFDHGDWVYSETIQERDPPVLFYNLFACGPGRFTDDNYLAGAYIFNTTYGLITIASSKSGSMLNFGDFTGPLSESNSIGGAFLEWFETQAPFELWEQEWYYGMVLNGDPTLRLLSCVDSDGDGFGDPGYTTNTCPLDNCPDLANPEQEDANDNGIGDACEPCCGFWTMGYVGNVDCSDDGRRNLADITRLIDRVYVSKLDLCCEENGNIDGDTESRVNLTDITRLIDHIYVSKEETAVCD